jgi:hypothetical protein
MNDDEIIDQMVLRLGRELKGVLSEVRQGRIPGAAIEQVIRDELWHVGAQALGVLYEALDKQLSARESVYDHRTRTMVSLFGPMDVSRARCSQGDGWRYPLDEALGLQGNRGWTLGVQEAVSLLSCETPFETVVDLMDRFFGLSLTAPTAEDLAELAGQRAADLPPLAPVDSVPDTLILATDGCQAPQRDGWHEVKMATMYTKESRRRSAGNRGSLGQKQYVASLEDCEGFGAILEMQAQAWQVQKVRRVVLMGDGAAWIWNLSEMHFPQAVEIVDFYHAVEHLWQAAEALWGNRDTSSATQSWVRRYRRKLKDGHVDLVIAGMERGHAQRAARLSIEAAKTVRLNLEYFRRNALRMRYGRFRQMNLPIGTGAVEGACKHVVQSRFKRPGTRWSSEGLRRMLALKVLRLNQQWERLWPQMKIA